MTMKKTINHFVGREMTTDYVSTPPVKKEIFSLLNAIEKDFDKLPEADKPKIKSILESDDIRFKDLEYLNGFVAWK